MLRSIETQCYAYIGIGLELLGADREDCIGKKPWFVIRRVGVGGGLTITSQEHAKQILFLSLAPQRIDKCGDL